MFRVGITRPLEAGAWDAYLATDWELENLNKPSQEQLQAAMRHCDGLVTMLTDRIDQDLLLSARGGPLKIIANHAVGIENIDLKTAAELGIAVTNTPGVLTHATAEFALSLLLNLLRRISEGERLIRSGQWTGWEPTQLLGSSLKGKKLGILGAGRIGQAFGHMAYALGAELAYTSRIRKPEFEQKTQAHWLDFSDLLAWSEILSLHLPGGPATRHLLNADTLSHLQPGTLLINTGRGTSIDERALAEALQSGHLGGAALDVYEQEPAIPSELLACPNLILAPHLGSATIETRRAMALRCLENLKAVFAGQPAPNQVEWPQS
ncbi:D-glycerate dehydrogenase [bacterium (Candidatus Blackallbacteria) CG17_big_fil_post_rev_8_21_14_2_50_48_46]|uniref:D-glycerate dehydrogenase n=1 Tax=bacterium (Candidatus Blackallbacteria) CG17_big_fil_post_rev_8_21_14_2_50_48_46 TaxID=2014261 RepID=A0A2M7G5W1_9BACT|nr:MAG: D-glycerate dehydrogenase [bacterium (Candidatus Blackallbacteria) CG18_big_fil_WC_8_21_14_2_50_49_26]PIW17437.1 MAG: D-glycerate dehydrogenase [bacterium (Candidatus Blackallbacteria) CG17_big_fil_post_rev_8_21_14_2_50_48_46]PIW48291.1 MAG: D-glycerate dehydrogenase [bacterium (Candidatus Blackallbacteria) CG13_big_fil_rev_8_21_14_2_50_49_14]